MKHIWWDILGQQKGRFFASTFFLAQLMSYLNTA